MHVLDFRRGHTPGEAINFYYRYYRSAFSGERLPDVTAIELNAFAPNFTIKKGMHYNDIPKARPSRPS